MIFLGSFIYKGLSDILGQDNVYEAYPSDFNSFPLASYEEESNIPYFKDLSTNEEIYSRISFKIDLWFKVEDDFEQTVKDINEYFATKNNFKRTFLNTVPDLDELRHVVIRYEGTVKNN